MQYLEISYIGSACGKNRYEPQDKTILLLLARHSKELVKAILFQIGGIIESDGNTRVYDSELKDIYSGYKKKITDVSTIDDVKNDIINKLKAENNEMTENDITIAKDFLDSSIKKDCGNNNESSVIKSKMYTKGNNCLHRYVPFHDLPQYELRGFHDASHNDIVIEIKTRMKLINVRKNDYDLYQLFGYLLVMGKTKGKIVQKFQDIIFDTDIENSKEFGLIDIENDKWKTKFEIFKNDLYSFFKKVEWISLDIENRHSIAMLCFNGPIAKIYNGVPKNVDINYEKIIKTLF